MAYKLTEWVWKQPLGRRLKYTLAAYAEFDNDQADILSPPLYRGTVRGTVGTVNAPADAYLCAEFTDKEVDEAWNAPDALQAGQVDELSEIQEGIIKAPLSCARRRASTRLGWTPPRFSGSTGKRRNCRSV